MSIRVKSLPQKNQYAVNFPHTFFYLLITAIGTVAVDIPGRETPVIFQRAKNKLMGKDRDGTFHPGKGKPSGANKEEGLGAQATPPEKMNEYNEMTEK